MNEFCYKDKQLYAEEVEIRSIASQFGTPCYIYSRSTFEKNWLSFDKPFGDIPHRICYAVKANSNLGILNLLARLGSGFDIVSQGELERVLAAGGEAKKIIFSGVGKTTAEIIRALEVGIYCFNVESAPEIWRIEQLAKQSGKVAPIALRINPDINARTHPYIATGLKENKFGISIEDILALCREIKKTSHLNLVGIGCHIGSQLTELSPILEAMDRLTELLAMIKTLGIQLKHFDIGGGLGVHYQNEKPPSITEYVNAVCNHLKEFSLEIILEPGRAIAANAGILLTRVEYLKHTPNKDFIIVDAAMNDFMRPALYDAWQNIQPVEMKSTIEKLYDIVGPVCESGDFLGKNRILAVEQNDLLAIFSAGAYGFSMSSNYNSRPRAAEVLVDKNHVYLIREREKIAELYSSEKIPD